MKCIHNRLKRKAEQKNTGPTPVFFHTRLTLLYSLYGPLTDDH